MCISLDQSLTIFSSLSDQWGRGHGPLCPQKLHQCERLIFIIVPCVAYAIVMIFVKILSRHLKKRGFDTLHNT